jgi:type VI protein secretion system component Hcp
VDAFRLTIKNVQIASYEHVGGDRATGERVCLSFTEADVEYRPRNADGSFGAPVRASL